MWGKQRQTTLFRPSNSMIQKKKIQILKKLLGKVEFFLKNHENDLQFCKISKNKESTLDVEDV